MGKKFGPKRIMNFFPKYGFGIRDPGSGKNLFRIPDPGSKRHRIPDPDPQHWKCEKNIDFSFLFLFFEPVLHYCI
jgi:hypothetical protein